MNHIICNQREIELIQQAEGEPVPLVRPIEQPPEGYEFDHATDIVMYHGIKHAYLKWYAYFKKKRQIRATALPFAQGDIVVKETWRAVDCWWHAEGLTNYWIYVIEYKDGTKIRWTLPKRKYYKTFRWHPGTMKHKPLWECPRCRWLMTDEEMQTIKADLGCPRCGKSFGVFEIKSDNKPIYKWRSGATMPKWASRYTLIVKGEPVVKRVQELTIEDLVALGYPLQEDCFDLTYFEEMALPLTRGSFIQHWNSRWGKKYPWDSNPYMVMVQAVLRKE